MIINIVSLQQSQMMLLAPITPQFCKWEPLNFSHITPERIIKFSWSAKSVILDFNLIIGNKECKNLKLTKQKQVQSKYIFSLVLFIL